MKSGCVALGLLLACAILVSVSAEPSGTDLITNFGYPVELHEVRTSDGFLLNLYRIPHGLRSSVSTAQKPVVFLQHGLMDTADTWTLNGPSSSLAFILADAEFDVWLANSRGSRDQPSVPNYDWTWDEMAAFDLPASLQYVRSQTGNAKINYIGHSQGSILHWASASRGHISPDWFNMVFALGPPVFLKHQRSTLFSIMGRLHADVALSLANCVFVPTLEFLQKFMKVTSWDYDFLLQSLFGPSNNLADSNWHGHFPNPTSSKNMAHWVEAARNGEFQQFRSSKKYDLGQLPAASYKYIIYYGTNDYMSSVEDVNRLTQELTKTKNLFHVAAVPGFAHMDFTWATSAKTAVYEPLLNQLRHAALAEQTDEFF